MFPFDWLTQAAFRIAPYINETPLTYDREYDLYLKWENRQVTGSFKTRGALNKVLSLQDWERQRGLVTASAGNHGQGVALAGKITGTPVIVFASDHAVPAKIAAMRALGAEVRLVAGGYGDAEKAGIASASANGMTWVSPYNDGQVIAGQGTLGIELQKQLVGQTIAAWIVPAGGGGLVSGIGACLNASNPGVSKSHRSPRLIAVSSDASPYLHALYHHGSQAQVVERPSLADGLAGEVEDGAVTIALVRQFADDFVLVSEAEIAQAIAFAWRQYHERIEGSAAVALAAALTGRVADRPAVIVLTGGNIEPELHARLCGIT